MNSFYLNEAHYAVMIGDFSRVKKLYFEFREKYSYIQDHNFYHTFRLLFTNACQHGKSEIARWLYDEIYVKLLDEEQKAELRPTFNLCFQRVKQVPRFAHLHTWLERIVIKMRDDYGGPGESVYFSNKPLNEFIDKK